MDVTNNRKTRNNRKYTNYNIKNILLSRYNKQMVFIKMHYIFITINNIKRL